jgi:hypothetical protein
VLLAPDDTIATRCPAAFDEDSAAADLHDERTTPVPAFGELRRALFLDPWHCGCGLRIGATRRKREPPCHCGTNVTATVSLTKRTRTVRPLISELDPIVRMHVFDDTHQEVGEVFAVSASDVGSVRGRWAIGIAIQIDEGDVDFSHKGVRYRFVRYFAELGWLQLLRSRRADALLLVQGPHVLRVCDALINCDGAPMDLLVERVSSRWTR